MEQQAEHFRFRQQVLFWENKFRSQGESYVGRKGEDFELQTKRIESLLRTRLQVSDFYKNALDFGCGCGRMLPFLSQFCGHLWAADIMPSVLMNASKVVPNVTAFQIGFPLKFPWREPRIDFLWVGLVFQHLTDEPIFRDACEELKRVLRPGARVLILDNGVDRAPHVMPRGPERLGAALNLALGWHAEKATINNAPGDHWLLDGKKA
jgi:SAM-dependent methyltransferase